MWEGMAQHRMADLILNSAISGTPCPLPGASASTAPVLTGGRMAELLMKSAIIRADRTANGMAQQDPCLLLRSGS